MWLSDCYMTVLKYVSGKGLVVVWRGLAYDWADGYHEDTYRISIYKQKNKPATITNEHISRKSLRPPDWAPEDDVPDKSYHWNSATMRFEEDSFWR